MAIRQEYLDDLERKGLVTVTGADGAKQYRPRTMMSPPSYNCQPYIPAAMSPDQWRDLVLKNFTEVYLAWWVSAFEALRDAAPDPQSMMAKTYLPVYNPDTQLWETQIVDVTSPPAGKEA